MDTERLPDKPGGALRIYPGQPYSAMLSLAAVLGSLCLSLAGAEPFAGLALFILSAFIVFTARTRVPVLGLLLPAYVFVLFTGSFSFPAAVTGISVSAAAVCLLLRGRRFALASAAALAATVIAAVSRGAAFAALGALPFLAGAALALTYCVVAYKYSVAAAGGAAALCVAAAGLIWLATSGTGLPSGSIADALRGAISDRFMQISVSGQTLMTEDSAAVLSEYIVNILPALAVCAALIPAVLQYKLCEALWVSAGLEDELPVSARELELSPVSGAVCALSFVFLTVFSLTGSVFAQTVCENVIYIMSPPFAVIGIRTIYRFFTRRRPSAKRTTVLLLCVAGAMIPLGFVAAAAWFGMMHSLLPVYRQIMSKFKNDES